MIVHCDKLPIWKSTESLGGYIYIFYYYFLLFLYHDITIYIAEIICVIHGRKTWRKKQVNKYNIYKDIILLNSIPTAAQPGASVSCTFNIICVLR